MRITFDTNSWQRVVRPDVFARDERRWAFQVIHEALKAGRVAGFISETVGTLEGIRRAQRGSYFADRRLRFDFTDDETVGTFVGGSVQISADHSRHPGLAGILTDMLKDATALGMRLMTAPRLGAARPPDFLTEDGCLRPEIFAQAADDADLIRCLDRFAEVTQEIEARGVGMAVVKTLGREIQDRHGGPNRPWFEYLDKAAGTVERKAIESAIAEWADGDAVASHAAFGNDVFCTEDFGKGAGKSVLDAGNRSWLTETYGIVFADLVNVADRIRSA